MADTTPIDASEVDGFLANDVSGQLKDVHGWPVQINKIDGPRVVEVTRNGAKEQAEVMDLSITILANGEDRTVSVWNGRLQSLLLQYFQDPAHAGRPLQGRFFKDPEYAGKQYRGWQLVGVDKIPDNVRHMQMATATELDKAVMPASS